MLSAPRTPRVCTTKDSILWDIADVAFVTYIAGSKIGDPTVGMVTILFCCPGCFCPQGVLIHLHWIHPGDGHAAALAFLPARSVKGSVQTAPSQTLPSLRQFATVTARGTCPVAASQVSSQCCLGPWPVVLHCDTWQVCVAQKLCPWQTLSHSGTRCAAHLLSEPPRAGVCQGPSLVNILLP